jgi:predicted DNA-binding transcriptional regulator YafY
MQKSIRLLKIWKLCREKRMMTALKLAEMCCVTERTIYRDIQALGEAGVLISYNKGYYIAEENPLPQLALSREEQLVLTLALQNLPLHMDEELENVVSGLLNKLLESPLDDPAIALDTTPKTSLKGHVFNRLQKAIDAHRKATLVEYYHLDGKLTRNRTVEPYLLVFRERNWYLVAWTPEYRDFRIYRMSRIARLRVEEQTFRPRQFDPREYFKGSLGIIVDKPQRMKARFSGLAKEIVKKDGRFSPHDMREEGGDLFLETTINGEIQWLRWLLGFGGEAEILEPEGMREKAIRMMREGLAGYGELE